MYLAVGILRVQEGLDYTGVIEEEDQVTPQQLLLDMKKDKEKGIVRNQSEGQLSHGKWNPHKALNYIICTRFNGKVC